MDPIKTNEIKGKKKTLKTESSCDLAALLLGIYLDKIIIQKDTCTPLFIAALFTTAKTMQQPKGLSTDEEIKKTWYLYTMVYYSVIKVMKYCHLQQYVWT